MFPWLCLLMALAVPGAQGGSQSQTPQLQNPGFESPSFNGNQIAGWDISIQKDAVGIVVQTGEDQAEEGKRSLVIDAKQSGRVRVSQEFFLPVGTTWKASVWVKGEA